MNVINCLLTLMKVPHHLIISLGRCGWISLYPKQFNTVNSLSPSVASLFSCRLISDLHKNMFVNILNRLIYFGVIAKTAVGRGRMVGLKPLVLLALLGRLAQAAVIQSTTPPPQTTIPPHVDTTTTPPYTTTPLQDCYWDGQYYPAGQDFNPSPCAMCHCPETGGEAVCAMMSCLLPACVDFTTEPGYCCPTCPNGKTKKQW